MNSLPSSDNSATKCPHASVSCLNPYEFIRKYRCLSCGGVMMCACEEDFARRFLGHQIREATELDTRRRVPVTMGFQAGVCNACRGIPEDAHPKSPQYGRTSKIVRYYWREIWFETTRRFADWCAGHTCADPAQAQSDRQDAHRRIEREVIEELKELHRQKPKYRFQEKSQQDVLTSNRVEVVKLDGIYVKQAQRKVALFHAGKTCTAEDFAALHFEGQGYRVLKSESIPFHALFGVYFWILIQDIDDPLVRMVGFGERGAAERREHGEMIWTLLPEDFGTPGYAQRRAASIDEHFATMLGGGRDDLLWTFDYWVGPSERLRQYLWAHRAVDISRAREIVSILPPEIVSRILRYLITAYWQRFCGWPDFLASRDGDWVFVEVKSSGDELSEDQKRWIKANSSELHLPFKLVKIHRKGVIDMPPTAGT